MAPETTSHEECHRSDYVACIFIWESYMFVNSGKNGLKIGGGGVSGAIFSFRNF